MSVALTVDAARGRETMTVRWPAEDMDGDLRPRIAAALAAGKPFALVTVSAADGGPRGAGAQMVVTAEDRWGFVSGGCIEADVAIHARSTIADGRPRQLVYGRGSPWIDTRLPCGSRLDILAERIDPGDPAVHDFVAAYSQRRSVRYQTNGVTRCCTPIDAASSGVWVVDETYHPVQRIIVVGSDPIALAIASLAQRLNWSSVVIWPHGPDMPPELGIDFCHDGAAHAILRLDPDAFTAIAIATHEQDQDEEAIIAALATGASYIGVLGARRRIDGRVARLRERGIPDNDIARVHMPIGLSIGASAPWEIAVSVTAAIIAERRGIENAP